MLNQEAFCGLVRHATGMREGLISRAFGSRPVPGTSCGLCTRSLPEHSIRLIKNTSQACFVTPFNNSSTVGLQ